MNRYLWTLAVTCGLLLQGCATTPSEIRELDERGQVEIGQPYAQAASCLSRQMNEAMVYWSPTRRMRHTLHDYPEQGYAEIVGEQNADGSYVVNIRPAAQDSATATIHVSRHMSAARDVAEDITRAAAKCNH